MNNAETVSSDLVEKTRMEGARIEGEILRRLADVTQARAAESMGVSPSTVSRAVEDIGRVAQLLAAIGMQVAEGDSMVVDRNELHALESMTCKYLSMRLARRGE